MFLLVSLALAAPPPADPTLARLSPPLRALAERPDADAIAAFRGRTRTPPPEEGVSVIVVPSGGPDELAAALRQAGYEVEAVGAGVVQVFVPYAGLYELSALPGVARVREPFRASPKSTRTEGWDVVMQEDWHDEGVTGEGTTVGVVDLGFSGWEDLGSDEFPVGAQANLQFEGDAESAHGAEVAEVLFDFAPDASWLLGSFETDAQLCEVMSAMLENDVDVINLSVGFDNLWSTDGSSGISQCVDLIAAEGVAVFVAAGNEAERYRSGALSLSEDGLIAVEGEDRIWIDSDEGYVDVRFRWSEPFGAAAEDIDLYIYNRDGSLCGSSAESQQGSDDPLEQVQAGGCGERVYVSLTLGDAGADPDGLEGWLYSASGIDAEQQLGAGSLSLPADAAQAITVGAWSIADERVASWSSHGPTQDGRLKPDVVAPAGVSTETLGPFGFDGTSAATPHAAGLGALWVSATGGNGEAEALKTWMVNGALDQGAEGLDYSSGAGLIQGDELPEPIRGCGCGVGRPGSALAAGLALLATLRRRRA